MTAHRLSEINLLPKDSFEESNLGRTLKWILAVGRVIVVFTEFVVIIAFGSRFWFDKRLNDLNEVITQKQMVVESFAEIERQMRDVLQRESQVALFLSQNYDIGNLFEEIVRATPADVNFSTISIDNYKISFEGVAKSETGFAGLLANLAVNPRVKTLALGETKFSDRTGEIAFKMSGMLNQKEVRR